MVDSSSSDRGNSANGRPEETAGSDARRDQLRSLHYRDQLRWQFEGAAEPACIGLGATGNLLRKGRPRDRAIGVRASVGCIDASAGRNAAAHSRSLHRSGKRPDRARIFHRGLRIRNGNQGVPWAVPDGSCVAVAKLCGCPSPGRGNRRDRNGNTPVARAATRSGSTCRPFSTGCFSKLRSCRETIPRSPRCP